MDFFANWLWYPVSHLPFVVITIVLAFTVHEFAHAYSAYRFGDHTAYNEGRVTLNPMSHLDMLGTALILIVGFGWAKPVPVNRGRFRNPRVMGIVVSAVGPLSNLVLAFISMLILYVLNETGLLYAGSPGVTNAIFHLAYYMIVINILLFIFNLLPLPPLDGYRIIQDLVPVHLRIRMDQYAHWGIFIFLLIVFIPPLRAVTLTPVLAQIWTIFHMLSGFVELLFSPLDWREMFSRVF